MKKYLFSIALLSLTSASAFAYLPVSAVSSMTLPVYGIYMTTDPTCTTGLVATVPLTTTAQSINFVKNPVIGTASNIPTTIGCVVIVIQNNFSSAWAAGTYTTTSGGNNDNVCNAGGSSTGQVICGTTQLPTWPTQVKTDAAAIGLTIRTTNCTGTSDIIALILSTNSTCTGNQTADAGTAACNGGNINNFALPTSAGDVAHGTHITAPSTAGNLKFIVNPTNAFGNNGSACGNTAAPLFSFAAY